MDLTAVSQGIKKRKLKKRVGRGIGSGHGKTASRGAKGQYASAGAKMFQPYFEGGQTPLFKKLPKRGFTRGAFLKEYQEINLIDLEHYFENGDTVSLETLRAKKQSNHSVDGLRVLGKGQLTKKLTVVCNHVSASAMAQIEAKGGTIELIAPPKKPVRNKMKPRPPKNPG